MRRLLRLCATALPVFALVGLPAARPGTSQQGELVRVPPLSTGQQRAPGGASFDAAEWVARLSLADLSERELAFEELVELAQDNGLATRWLRERSADGDELAWTCRLALRETLRARRDVRTDGRPEARSEGRSEVRPEGRSDGRNGAQSLPGFGFRQPFGARGLLPDPFESAERQMQELRRQLQAMREGGSVSPPAGARSFSGKQLSIEQTAAGAKVTLKEIVEGEERVQTYEGESLEQILEQNPELSEEVGLYGGHQGYAFGAVPGLSLGPHGLRSFLGEESVQVQRTDVLGVYVRPLSAEEARARGLAQDAGLFVQGVEPRTIAHAVGLMPGDVLTELGGELVSGSEDIARALSSRAADSELRVAWVSADGRRESRTWAPERDEAGAAR